MVAKRVSVLMFVATESKAYRLEDYLRSIHLDFSSITGTVQGNRGQSERGQALKIIRDDRHTIPKVLIATDEGVVSAEDISTVDIVW